MQRAFLSAINSRESCLSFLEELYAALFPSDTGMPAKPLQTALGTLMIQKSTITLIVSE